MINLGNWASENTIVDSKQEPEEGETHPFPKARKEGSD